MSFAAMSSWVNANIQTVEINFSNQKLSRYCFSLYACFIYKVVWATKKVGQKYRYSVPLMSKSVIEVDFACKANPSLDNFIHHQ